MQLYSLRRGERALVALPIPKAARCVRGGGLWRQSLFPTQSGNLLQGATAPQRAKRLPRTLPTLAGRPPRSTPRFQPWAAAIPAAGLTRLLVRVADSANREGM